MIRSGRFSLTNLAAVAASVRDLSIMRNCVRRLPWLVLMGVALAGLSVRVSPADDEATQATGSSKPSGSSKKISAEAEPDARLVNAKAEGRKSENPRETQRSQKSRVDVDFADPAVQEKAAIAFARKHHRELADLLDQLKKGNPQEYQRALRELWQTSERLARIEERSPDRYPFLIEGWKLDSRIRLLSARMVMSESPALEAELKESLRARSELRLRELNHEREKVLARLQKLETEIKNLEERPDEVVRREFQLVRKQLNEKADELNQKRQPKSRNTGSKGGSEKPASAPGGKTPPREKPAKEDAPKAESANSGEPAGSLKKTNRSTEN